MGKYLIISIAMAVIGWANYMNGTEHKDEPVKFWISTIVAIVCGVVAHIAFWKYVLTLI